MTRFLYSTLLVCGMLCTGSFAAAQQTPAKPAKPAQGTSTAREAWKRLAEGKAVPDLSGKPAAITFSTNSVNFGSEPVGATSAAVDVKITNTDAVNLTVTNEQVTANFGISSDTCLAGPVAPNGTCDIFVVFAPTSQGSLSGTLTVTDNATGSPQAVNLSGIGTALSVTTNFLEFGKQIMGTTSASQPVTVTNNAAVTVHITGVVASPGFTQTNNCGGLLAPNSSCTFNISFAPTILCNESGSITVNVDLAGASFGIFTQGNGAGSGGLSTTDLNTLTPNNLVNSLLGSGVTASNITYTGANVAAGNFSGGAGILGIDTGIVLSSGSISNVIGPNCSTAITTANGTLGDTDLNTLVSPNSTFDASVLQFDFVPASNTITFQYVFSSDEYNEFANSPFNDVFAFFVNGTNVALLPGTTTIVSINNVNGGNPLGTNPQNPQFFINNDFQLPSPAPLNTEMDGLTVVLTVQATVNAGQTNHIKLAIADTSDDQLDSNVFIKAGSFTSASVTVSPSTLAFGNQAPTTTSAPKTVTVSNNGNTAVTINTITATANFAITNNQCPASPATLAAGATCTFAVVFSPAALGPVAGTATVNDTDGGSPHFVTLSGTGAGTPPTGPIVSLSPATLTFASLPIGGTSSAQTVTLTNTGNAPLTVISVAASGDFADTTTCVTASPIAANGTCTISVTFKPTAAGARSGSITIVDNAPGSPHTVGLTGTGSSSTFNLTVQTGTATTLTVNPGDTAIFFLTLAGTGGFTGTVALGCSSSQPSITCSVSPTSATLSPGVSTVTAITLNTFCSWGTPRGTLPWDRLRGIPGLWLAAGLGLLLLGLTLSKNRRMRIAVPVALLVLLAMAGCSGGPSGPSGRTPAGTYNLTITATSQGVTQSTQVTLIVK